MRVISGTARGTKLNSIDSISTRPTLDRVKESLFNILQPYIYKAHVLDLFAGSGALGIEALSRGAQNCTFCDKSYESVQMLKQNIQRTKLVEKSIVIHKDYKVCLKMLKGKKFDIIFLDPPYKLNVAVDAIKIILELKLLNKNGIIVIETDEKEREEEELKQIESIDIVDVRKYGRVNLLFLHERG